MSHSVSVYLNNILSESNNRSFEKKVNPLRTLQTVVTAQPDILWCYAKQLVRIVKHIFCMPELSDGSMWEVLFPCCCNSDIDLCCCYCMQDTFVFTPLYITHDASVIAKRKLFPVDCGICRHTSLCLNNH